MVRKIHYGRLMHSAMRGLIQKVLADVAANGLPGEHHFFITFDTAHPDVGIAEWLCDRYPGEMTIVIQHWFEDLDVRDDGFAVTLNFGDSPERLDVPYDSIRTFADPSVEFGLRFESREGEEEEDDDEADDAPMLENVEDDEAHEGNRGDAEVVSLDSFRK